MNFGEVIHLVTQPAGWPEPVRGIASLLSSFHCPNTPSNENFSSASASVISEPLASHETPAPELYTAKDFQILIHSTAAELSALPKLPHYGSKRSTVYLWAQLVHALANTLSPDAVILEEAPFIMPRAQNVSCQPENLIEGHATLLVAHAIFSEPRTHSDRAWTNTRNKEDQDESMCSADQDELICSSDQDESICSSDQHESIRFSDQDESITSADQDELICFADQDELICSADQDESICSADSDSCDGLVDSLDLPLQALMLPGRGRCLSAVVPVLLVADPYNIIPLLCSALYQRHVWGIRQPVVGLCCSSTDTIATAIFGWLESDQSEEGRMPRAHLAFSADVRSDPLMGVFDFTDTSSATSLAQFILGLRTHFEDIKGATSIEAVDSLTPLHWRSDVPDFETQFWGQSDERVASWTRQVYVQTCASDVPSSSSSTPRTPSPLLDTVPVYETMSRKPPSIAVEGEEVDIGLQDSGTTNARGSGKRPKSGTSVASSAFSNSQFAAQADGGLSDAPSISNWLLERKAFTVGRIPVDSEELANKTGINTMVKIYDRMTAFTWSDKIKEILSQATVDGFLVTIRDELCNAIGDLNCQSSEIDEFSLEKDIEFISNRLSALLHAVENARSRDDYAKRRSVNEAERRHEWDSLLLDFTKPIKIEDQQVENQQVVLLERKLNLARNLAVDDSSFVKNAMKVVRKYRDLCQAQHDCLDIETESLLYEQSSVAEEQAKRFIDVIKRRDKNEGLHTEKIQTHSSRDPVIAICDAVLVIPISSKPKKLLNDFKLVVDPQPEKLDTSEEIPYHVATGHKTASTDRLEVPSNDPDSDRDHILASRKVALYQGKMLFRCNPDGRPAIHEKGSMPSTDELLLPVLFAEYKKKDTSALSTGMNQMRTYQVSAVTFLSALGITDHPVFGLVVNGTHGAITMAWKKNDQIYVMERNVRNYDIRDPFQALQFVSILRRLTTYGVAFQKKLSGKQLAISNVEWSKIHQGERDDEWRKTLARRKKEEQTAAEGGAKK